MRFLDSIYFETTTGSLKEENMLWQIKLTFFAETSYTGARHWAARSSSAASAVRGFRRDRACVSHTEQSVSAFNRDVQNI